MRTPMAFRTTIILALLLTSPVVPAQAQFTMLDSAQDAQVAPVDGAESGASPPPAIATPCGTQPMTIARMTWPSAALLSEIHARVLKQAYGCDARVIPGDLAATTSSMGSTGQPAMAPEMWVTRIADVWNGAVDAQMLRSAAPTYDTTTFEGWFVPSYMNASDGSALTAAGLTTLLAGAGTTPVRFISCPADWACSVINRNLIKAQGLADRLEIVEPANRFEMDALIAEAVSRRENFVFYYWQPNAVLAQLDFKALDMGAFDEAAMKCLAAATCADPKPSAFPSELVVSAVAEWVFTEAPNVAGYFQRATLPIAEMNRLLAQANEPGATIEGVAERFVAEHSDIWQAWTGGTP